MVAFNEIICLSPCFFLCLSATGHVFSPQGGSGSEPEDDNQTKFYTEQHRGRRRSKGEEKCNCAFLCWEDVLNT